MTTRQSKPAHIYKLILERPVLIIICLLAIISFLGYQAKHFKLDASAETLVLENDEDLRYSRLINSRYGGHDYLIMTYAPEDDLFSDKALENLTRLRDDLRGLECVASVTSILDVPLLESPPIPIKELISNIRNLESPSVDRDLARVELGTSPIYQNLLISSDLKVTALQINFPVDEVGRDLIAGRDYLRNKKNDGLITSAEIAELKKVIHRFEAHREKMKKKWHRDIVAIRDVMDNYRQDAEVFLGGINMIADDLITFIRNDLKIFGMGVLFFLIVTLSIIFRQVRWILLPLLCCLFSGVCMIGLLGMFGWQVTVISSNFISLQLIITMAIIIHLIVRYRELLHKNPGADQRRLVLDTVRLMLIPCLYTSLTTIAGFGSLLLCNILPVITFGWMMIGGIVVSFIMTFLFFPAALMLLGKGGTFRKGNKNFSFTALLGRFTESHGIMILVISGVTLAFSIIGVSRLVVENSFIDYFKDTSEIHGGMKTIDRNLGGTTPMDITIDLEAPETPALPAGSVSGEENDDELDDFDEFEEEEDDKKYWFTSDKMALIVRIHDYLDKLPETGKVLSLGTMMKVAEKLNKGKPLDNFQLALLYSEIPDKFKTMALKPYVSIEDNQVRFSIRIRDSEKSLKRNRLINQIRHDLVNKLGFKKEHVHLSGMLVLYNNMLQSLFSSQIRTLGVAVLALMLMFLILFRSLKIASIAIFPNLLAIGTVLGFMGWMNIPLDMMTITIAAISMGIAVDNTIHYIHRFKYEFPKDRDYIKTLHRCHGSIGHAMYYTSITIITGFSILCLSNFIPSIYFGLLTGLAMLIALFASLTLLPRMLVLIKPFDKL
ncbi:MAG: RND family transporter [Desulfobacterales bacterium]|nr:RND family transporter [Desulfobacterales bacterium]